MDRRWFMSAVMRLIALGILVGVAGAAADPEKPWKRHVIHTGLKGSDGVRFLDADGDGLLDCVTGWEQSGVTTVSFNPGKDRIKEPWPTLRFDGVRGVEDAFFVDLDGDGATDVVSSCEAGAKAVFVHWGPKRKEDYR